MLFLFLTAKLIPMNYKNKIPIHSWAEDDRPREKFILKGKETLSDAELLAILIGSGNGEDSAVELARIILLSSNNNLLQLSKKNLFELKQIKGIGGAKAVTLLASFELARRYRNSEILNKLSIKTSKDAFEYFQPFLADKPHEEFWALYLDRANQIIKHELISIGGKSGTIVDMKILFSKAIMVQASGIIVAHNHPTGNLKPSEQDIKLTSKLKEASKLLDISILDHIIIGENRFYSFADSGF